MAPSGHAIARLALLLASLVALATTAQASVPVGLYPVQGDGIGSVEAEEVQDLLLAGLRSTGRRDRLRPRPEPVLEASCGAKPSDPCLAKLAGDGVVLVAKARNRQGAWVVTLSLVNAQGRRTRPISFAADLEIQDLRGVNEAVAQLEFELDRLDAASRMAPPPGAMTTASAPSTNAEGASGRAGADRQARIDVRPDAALSADTRATPQWQPVRSTPWQDTAGTWCTAGGAAMLVGGVVAGVYGKRLSASLDRKYQEGRLLPSDASSFDRVQTASLVANTLLISGGIFTATGLTFWAIAPDVRQTRGRTTIGITGSF